MSMLSALGLLGHGAQGFVEGRRDAERDQRDREDQAWRQEQRAYMRAAQARDDAERGDLAAAAAPQTPQIAPPDSNGGVTADEEGNPMPQPAPTAMVNGARVPMQQATEQLNSPEAIKARQIAVLQRTNPAKAAQMQASVTAEKVSQLDLAAKEFDDHIASAAGVSWDALGEAMSKSGASPMKGKWIISPDGKTAEAAVIQPDGSLKPTGTSFPNTAAGRLEAAGLISKTMPVQQKLAHKLAAEQLVRQEKRDADVAEAARRRDETQRTYYEGLIEERRHATDAKAAGRTGDHFTEKEWDAAHKVDASSISFPDVLGGKGIESPALREAYRTRLTELRANGDVGPDVAASDALVKVGQLRNLAMQRVAEAKAQDPKSTLTEDQAVTQIMASARARAAAAQRASAAPQQPPAGGAPAAPPVVAPASPTAPAAPAGPMQAAAAPPVDPGPQPPRLPTETFSQYRERLVMWDQKRRAFNAAANAAAEAKAAAIEDAQRRAALAQRPDLQEMAARRALMR